MIVEHLQSICLFQVHQGHHPDLIHQKVLNHQGNLIQIIFFFGLMFHNFKNFFTETLTKRIIQSTMNKSHQTLQENLILMSIEVPNLIIVLIQIQHQKVQN